MAEPPRSLTGFLRHGHGQAYARMTHVRQPVYLVRHGQSVWNVRRLTQGQTLHPELTELGRTQAARAAKRIAGDLGDGSPGVGRILTSDLNRAVATAEVIAARLGAPVIQDVRLREQHLGSLEGRSYEETWAAAEAHDWSDPTLPIAGGESVMGVHDRMAAVLDELDPDVVTVLVSHGDAIRAALSYLAGVAPHRAAWVEVPNGAVARLTGSAAVWLP